MFSYLPWLLLGTTITVRALVSKKMKAGFYIDLATVPPWLLYYFHNGSYPLLAVPLIFGSLDIRAITRWWK